MLKKSQMKILESIFVLIIFFFILIFGIIFYARFSQISGEDAYRDIMLRQGMDSTERFKYSNEVLCTSGWSGTRSDCIDIFKLKAFMKLGEERSEQFNQYYPNSIINVTIVYPESNARSMIVFNSTTGNEPSSSVSFIPVVLYNATSERNYFGFIKYEARY